MIAASLSTGYFALAGALTGALATVVGGSFAARAADRRQERQLARDRETQDRAELRILLDETAALAWDAASAGAKFFAGINSLAAYLSDPMVDRVVAELMEQGPLVEAELRERLRAVREAEKPKREAELEKHGPQLIEAQRVAFEAAWKLENQVSRIQIRLGVSHPVTKALIDLRDSAHVGAKLGGNRDDSTFNPDGSVDIPALQRANARYRHAFLQACHALLSAEPITEPVSTASGPNR